MGSRQRRSGAAGLGPVVAAASALALLGAGAGPLAGQVGAESGTLVVLDKSAATALLIDVESGQTRATLPTGDGPHEVAISSDGRWAVATDYGGRDGGSTLTIIDVQARRVISTARLGEYARPHGIAFMPGDSLVAVTSEAAEAVVFVSVPRGRVAGAISTNRPGSHMLALVEDGSTIYTGDIGSNTVSELDVAAAAGTRTFDVPAQPEAITVTPDGAEVWVGSNATGRVSVVSPATGSVETAAEGFGWPYRILVSPDRATVVIPDLRQNRVRFFERQTRRELAAMDFAGAGPQGIIYGPDGRTIYLSLSAQGRVAVIDSGARSVLRYIDAGQSPDGIGFSGIRLPPR